MSESKGDELRLAKSSASNLSAAWAPRPSDMGQWQAHGRPLAPSLCNLLAMDDNVAMPEDADTVTLDQMREAVGSLLFLWSDVERSLQAAI